MKKYFAFELTGTGFSLLLRRLSLLLMVVWATNTAAGDLRLINAKIVDPRTGEIRTGELWIQDGIIVDADEKPELDGEVLDLEGKWVIPGLNELHTHAYGNMGPGGVFDSPGTEVVAKRLLYAGVTGFLDLFGDEETLFALRERQRSGEFVGATIFASLSCLTATEGHCTEYGVETRVMDSPEDARKVVSDLARKNPDVAKIVYAPSGRMPSIDKATLNAAVATATQNGIKTVIHIQTWDGVRDAVDAGASAITHIPEDAIPEGFASLLAESDVITIPTLAVETDLGDYLFDPAVLDNPMAQRMTTPEIVSAYRTEEIQQRFSARRESMSENSVIKLSSVKAWADAGVTILAGSDAGNWGTIQGYSVHRELIKMVKAGLTPWQALASSTTLAGDFLGRSFGVQPGDEANLVVLEESPIDDISNTQKIDRVIYQGEIIDREALMAK